MDIEKFKKLLQDKYSKVNDLDNLIHMLKEAGAGYIETIGALAQHTGLSVKQIEEVVINSPTWIAEKDQIIEMRNFILDILTKGED